MPEKITACRITEYPKSFSDPMPIVMVRFDGQEDEQELFSFYPDEIYFYPNEFIGLTRQEAIRLKFTRDKAYLAS